MNKDLTVGKPETVLWQFCLPLFGSIVFQQMYNIADSLIAGRFIGEGALAAVGNSYQITLFFIAFAFGCNIGCSVIVSQLFGAKKYEEMKTAVYTTWISGAVVCTILMAIGLIGCQSILQLIQTPPEIYEGSAVYLNIYIWGFPFLLFYNVANGIFTALGDSKTPFYFLAGSSVANIGVDVLFVVAFRMGIAGVAWATFLCQGISCVLAVWFVVKRLATVKTEGKSSLFSFAVFKKIVVIAVPSILQQSFISLGNIILQGTINSYGSGVIAGYSTSVKLNNLVITSFTTIGNGISNFTAQNLGAAKYERIKAGLKAGIKLVWALSVPIVLVYVTITGLLVHIFMENPSQEAMSTGIIFLRILAPFYFVISIKLVADGVLRGAGLMKQFMIATFSDLILRVVLAIVFSSRFGSVGIWCSWPIGWSMGVLISLFFYKRYTDRLPRHKDAEGAETDVPNDRSEVSRNNPGKQKNENGYE